MRALPLSCTPVSPRESLPVDSEPPVEEVRDADGTITCWGSNPSGEATPPSDTWAMGSSGLGISSCGLTTAGEVRCWGEAVNGSRDAPSELDQQLTSLGYYGGAALDLTGHVTVWGKPTFGM